MAEAPKTKALRGSAQEQLERQNEAIREAIREAGLVEGSFWISDTFEDYVVISRWDDAGSRNFRIDYSMDGEEVVIGAMREVKKVYVEELVDPGAESGSSEMTEKKRPPQTKVRRDFTCKSLEEADDDVGGWIGSGVFSVFEKKDYSKDVVRKGATTKSIAKRLPKIKDHHGVTVGQATKAAETDEGLEVDFRIYPTSAGKDLATLMKQIDTDHGPKAPVEEGSIGFGAAPGGATRNKDGGYDFTEIEVWECSPVTFGDNPYTRVGLKSAEALGEMPTDELLGYVGEMLRSAVEGPSGVKTLHRRRVAEDRDLKAEHWKAVTALTLDALETAEALLTLEGHAGTLAAKATSAQMRHTQAIISSIADLVHGRSEPAAVAPAKKYPDEDEAVDEESKDDSRGESARSGKAGAKSKSAAPEAEAFIDVEFKMAQDQFRKLAEQTS